MTGDEHGPQEPGGEMPEEIEAEFSQQLRALYNGVLAEPVPDSILELLNKLKAVATSDASDDPSA